jgi:dGTPase
MDLSDDIAYSVHDFEDAILTGYVDVAALSSSRDHDDLLTSIQAWVGDGFGRDELGEALDGLCSLEIWLAGWDGSRASQARLKNLTSQLIGRFAGRSTWATKERYPNTTLSRFSGSVIVPSGVAAEIAVLKGIVAAYVMSSDSRQPIYAEQRALLTSLADELYRLGEGALEVALAADWRAATSDAERKRVVVDQIASLTDQSAISWGNGLLG